MMLHDLARKGGKTWIHFVLSPPQRGGQNQQKKILELFVLYHQSRLLDKKVDIMEQRHKKNLTLKKQYLLSPKLILTAYPAAPKGGEQLGFIFSPR